ncbi:hypothetical protein GCM10025789_12210 [Tessaracoccus lubricantis]|uniref:Tail sheath protein C-terminal domain-containing protein n=1 Tax=Tessaracoccus lubricantis TaxID=545543 RepID=A0ABP9F849_9ACTN
MPNDETPGVYIDETPAGPATIPPWGETVAAFVGHTERATGAAGEDVTLIPQRVGSLAEFESLFGGAQPEVGVRVDVVETPAGRDVRAAWADGVGPRHVVHPSLQLYFANGGRSALIVSVGRFGPDGAGPVADELRAGVDALAAVDEVSLIVVPETRWLPEAEYAAVYRQALDQCAERKDRFVLLDLPGSGSDGGAPSSVVDRFREADLGSHHRYGAAYWPDVITHLPPAVDEARVEVVHTVDGVPGAAVPLAEVDATLGTQVRAAIADLRVSVPPSGAVAGVYAHFDRTRGVWKAPAGIELKGVAGPAAELTARELDALQEPTRRSVNVIRRLAGRGIQVWGARTLAGADTEFRYVNVRRLVSHVEDSVRRGLWQFVFEPNDAATWARVRQLVDGFLTGLWQAGALVGTKPEEAFRVDVGLGRTMTQQDVVDGLLVLSVGLATTRPAEFIIVRFGQRQQAG